MNTRIMLPVLALLSGSRACLATPEQAVWHHEMLIGASEDMYFVWVAEWGQPGSYYSSWETVTIEVRRLSDRELVETHPILSSTESYDHEEERWILRQEPAPVFDIAGFLLENKASPAFPEELPEGIAILDTALVITRDSLTATVLTADQVLGQIPGPGSDARVAGAFMVSPTGGHSGEMPVFVAVLGNTAAGDDSWTQNLLLVPRQEIMRAWLSIRP